MFLTMMVIGLAGLFVMALPGFLGRGHAAGHAHGALRAAHVGRLAPIRGAGAAGKLGSGAGSHAPGGTRFLPSPRMIFSVLALFGAFGNLLEAAGLARAWAALAAVVPALLVERFAVTPVWNLLFRFQGQPSSPLATLVLSDAKAVTPFRNGRGIVAVARDGRLVQFAARLAPEQADLRVEVGDVLRVEDVDPERERLTVSVVRA